VIRTAALLGAIACTIIGLAIFAATFAVGGNDGNLELQFFTGNPLSTIAQVSAAPDSAWSAEPGGDPENRWLRARTAGTPPATTSYVLERSGFARDVRLIFAAKIGIRELLAGGGVPARERALPDIVPAFPLDAATLRERILYFQELGAPVGYYRVLAQDRYNAEISTEHRIFGTWFAIVIALGLLFVFRFVRTKRATAGAAALFCGALVAHELVRTHYVETVFSTIAVDARLATRIAFAAMVLGGFAIVRATGHIARRYPRFDLGLIVAFAATASLAIASQFLPPVFATIVPLLALTFFIPHIVLLVLAAQAHVRDAIFGCIALVGFLGGSLASVIGGVPFGLEAGSLIALGTLAVMPMPPAERTNPISNPDSIPIAIVPNIAERPIQTAATPVAPPLFGFAAALARIGANGEATVSLFGSVDDALRSAAASNATAESYAAGIAASAEVAQTLALVARRYDARIVVEETVLASVTRADKYVTRFLGSTTLAGLADVGNAFEILAPGERDERKRETITLFQTAIASLTQQYVIEAAARFTDLAKRDPTDGAAAYLERHCTVLLGDD